MSKKPFYMRYPSDFIAGIVGLSSDQICVYAVLLDLMYARRRPLEASKPSDIHSMAGLCSMSTRRFNAVVEELIAIPNKITRDDQGRLTNPKFQRWLDQYGDPQNDPQTYPQENEKGQGTLGLSPENRQDNRGDNRADKSTHIEPEQALSPNSHPSLSRARVPHNQKEEEYTVDRVGLGQRRKSQNGFGGALAPAERLSRFQKSLAQSFPVDGWRIVLVALDPKHPAHKKCLDLCKRQAAKMGKGWPKAWPKGP